jgi:sugar-specific transcriptional regulator TrmB
VQGTLTPFANHMERVSQLIEKSRSILRLTAEEARVCAALCELPEADANSVARFAKVPHSTADSILLGLKERGIVISSGKASKTYSLTQEHLEYDREKT